jgi:hypothetical protein
MHIRWALRRGIPLGTFRRLRARQATCFSRLTYNGSVACAMMTHCHILLVDLTPEKVSRNLSCRIGGLSDAPTCRLIYSKIGPSAASVEPSAARRDYIHAFVSLLLLHHEVLFGTRDQAEPRDINDVLFLQSGGLEHNCFPLGCPRLDTLFPNRRLLCYVPGKTLTEGLGHSLRRLVSHPRLLGATLVARDSIEPPSP